LSAVVLDCSVALMWAFQDEATAATDRFLDRVMEDGAFVPASGIWKSPTHC
jgi:hypothetical protein